MSASRRPSRQPPVAPSSRPLLLLLAAGVAAAASAICGALPLVAAAAAGGQNGGSGGARCGQATLSVTDVVKLASLIRDRIYCLNNATDNDGIRYHPLIPGLVRLGFHSSIDRTQIGCVNLDDQRQAGLRVAVEEMERLYQQTRVDPYYADVSRSDLWALGSIVAIEVATHASLFVNFSYGRCDDCGADSYATSQLIRLPDQAYTGDETIAYLESTFGMTYGEAVAIMGAHSLGFVTDGAGHIIDKWIPNPELLTNGYYVDMMNGSLGWKQVPHYYPPQNRTAWAWTHGDGTHIYLNCDMGLYKALSVPDNATGVSDCTYSKCPLAGSNLWVAYFAANLNGFYDHFASAFAKMLDHGLTGLRQPA